MTTRTMNAATFKARCLREMDRVQERGESLVITKRGRPVVRVVPARGGPRRLKLGALAKLGQVVGDVRQPAWAPEEWASFR